MKKIRKSSTVYLLQCVTPKIDRKSCAFCSRRRRKPRADHFYSEAVNYNKKSRDEKLLAVHINDESERPAPENVEKKRNVVTVGNKSYIYLSKETLETEIIHCVIKGFN